MIFDIQLSLDYFIPDSLSDAGALLFWALLLVLVIIIAIDIRLYLKVRKTPHNSKKPFQTYPTEEQMKIFTDEPTTDIGQIRKKVDRLIQLHEQ
jgi:hypothetical protein